jgi:hypothetical protein
MDELEFIGRMNPQRLTSLSEDFKSEQTEFRNDEAKRKVRSDAPKTILETTYERFLNSEDGGGI